MVDLNLAIYDISPRPEGLEEGKSNPNTLFSRNVCKILEVTPADAEVVKFGDGETDITIPRSVRKKKIFVFQSYVKPLAERKYEAELFIDGVTWGGYKKGIVLVWPHAFGSRGERRTKARQPCPTLVYAQTLGSLNLEKLLTGGVHADIGVIYNSQEVSVEALEFEAIAANYILRNYKKNVALVSPDVGGLKRVQKIERIINDKTTKDLEGINLETKSCLADKIRSQADKVGALDLLDSVKDLDVLLIDDIFSTGTTLRDAAKKCKEGGATSVRALAYHATLAKGYEEQMKELLDGGLIDKLVLGNTIPLKSFAKKHPKIKILPFEPIFATAIQRSFEDESISELYRYEGIMDVYDRTRYIFKHDSKYVKIGRLKRNESKLK